MLRRLLDEFQRDFPLTPGPFAAIARSLGTTEAWVLATLSRLVDEGSVSRVGAVFRPGSVGASTLAAMAVAEERLPAVAELVSAHPEVNHNYEREHRLNLWFVVTAADEARVIDVLAAIERETLLEVIPLPLMCDYHIDLGFGLDGCRRRDTGEPLAGDAGRIAFDVRDRALLGALQEGLPLVPRPYASLARCAGWRGLHPERDVLQRLRTWIECGAIKRFGVIVRHRALGFVANAMCAWDVPAWDTDRLGRLLAREPVVTLCYHRARAGEAWRYNLFCMIHGRDRNTVDEQLATLSHRHGLDAYPHAVLFSRRAFKQRGARYVEPAEVAHG
ncbi:MAG TPA: Lrp/AsnC family transcriptional regulator [Casimicrobiaceae bacterium]|nr:Lrp/AsnC family transcriptional regulator [Casimicrobiaceae bacterium]